MQYSSFELNQNLVDALGLINAETQQLKAVSTRAAESSERLEGHTKALVRLTWAVVALTVVLCVATIADIIIRIRN